MLSVDIPFSTSYAVCFFIFVFELTLNSWSRTTFHSWYPLRFEGYLFSFFWWLDLISTLSLVPDIAFIAVPLGIASLSDPTATGKPWYWYMLDMIVLCTVMCLFAPSFGSLCRVWTIYNTSHLMTLLRTNENHAAIAMVCHIRIWHVTINVHVKGSYYVVIHP